MDSNTSSYINGLFELHPSYYRPMQRVGGLLLVLALIQLLTWLTPPQFDAGGIRGYLPLHVLFEIASIVVSMMVFTVGWNAHSRLLLSRAPMAPFGSRLNGATEIAG
jgi:hypothetical protein